MKTPEEIKKGLMCYRGKHPFAIGNCPPGCPYEEYGTSCRDRVNMDALAYIQQLESRLAQVEREKGMKVSQIDDLKRALVEVATICSRYEPTCGVKACPFWSNNRNDCALKSYRPDFWDVAGWKEDEGESKTSEQAGSGGVCHCGGHVL